MLINNLNRPQGVESLVVSTEGTHHSRSHTIAGLEGGLDEGDGVNDTPEEGADDGVRAYNNFWVDPGSNLAMVKGEYRTSYVIDPPNGRAELENHNTISIAPVLVPAMPQASPISAARKPFPTPTLLAGIRQQGRSRHDGCAV